MFQPNKDIVNHMYHGHFDCAFNVTTPILFLHAQLGGDFVRRYMCVELDFPSIMIIYVDWIK